MIHRPRVVAGRGKAVATCNCKWVGEIRATIQEARADANDHEFEHLTVNEISRTGIPKKTETK